MHETCKPIVAGQYLGRLDQMTIMDSHARQDVGIPAQPGKQRRNHAAAEASGFNDGFDEVRLDVQETADLAASFQEAVVDCLLAKAFLALERTGLATLCVGGGVAANRLLRLRLDEEAQRAGVRLHVAPLELCTDNAVMGAIAVERYKAGRFEPLDLDVSPGVVRRTS